VPLCPPQISHDLTLLEPRLLQWEAGNLLPGLPLPEGIPQIYSHYSMVATVTQTSLSALPAIISSPTEVSVVSFTTMNVTTICKQVQYFIYNVDLPTGYGR
jgi:hypothetical protein